MKITVYTVTDCKFSAQEKEYLKSHNLPFVEKNLEKDREYLTEMLALSNNFAGTPVTRIEKDDGSTVVLKGFTQEEFDKELGFGGAPTSTSQEVKKPEEQPKKEEQKPVTQPSEQAQPTQPPQEKRDVPLSSEAKDVLDKLQNEAKQAEAAVSQPSTETPQDTAPAPQQNQKPTQQQPNPDDGGINDLLNEIKRKSEETAGQVSQDQSAAVVPPTPTQPSQSVPPAPVSTQPPAPSVPSVPPASPAQPAPQQPSNQGSQEQPQTPPAQNVDVPDFK